jgi:nitrogen fixation protein FixH
VTVRLRLNWGVSIAIVYAVFAGTTMGFVVFAMSRPVDLVSPEYYQRSLQQDARIAAEANARALTRPVTVSVDAARRHVTISWPSEFAAATGEITLYRPSDSKADRRFPVIATGGVQTIDARELASGRWRLQAEWSVGGRSFYKEDVVMLP